MTFKDPNCPVSGPKKPFDWQNCVFGQRHKLIFQIQCEIGFSFALIKRFYPMKLIFRYLCNNAKTFSFYVVFSDWLLLLHRQYCKSSRAPVSLLVYLYLKCSTLWVSSRSIIRLGVVLKFVLNFPQHKYNLNVHVCFWHIYWMWFLELCKEITRNRESCVLGLLLFPTWEGQIVHLISRHSRFHMRWLFESDLIPYSVIQCIWSNHVLFFCFSLYPGGNKRCNEPFSWYERFQNWQF